MADIEISVATVGAEQAAKDINKLNAALGGETETGKLPNGWVDPYANAAKEMEELGKQFYAAQAPVKKAGEELGKTGKQADLLGTAIKAVGIVSPQAAANLNRLRGVGKEVGDVFAESSASLTSFGMAAIAAAAAVEGVVISMYLLKQANEYTVDVLLRVGEHSKEIVEIATEYQKIQTQIAEVDIWGNINNNLGLWTATTITLVADKIKYLMDLLNQNKDINYQLYETRLVGGYNETMNAGGGFAGGDFAQRYSSQAKSYEDMIKQMNEADKRRANEIGRYNETIISMSFAYQDQNEAMGEQIKKQEEMRAILTTWGPLRLKTLNEELEKLGEGTEAEEKRVKILREIGWLSSKNWVEQSSQMKKLTEQTEEMAKAQESAFNRAAIAGLEASAKITDGFTDDGERDFILGIAHALGELSDDALIAATRAAQVQSILNSIMSMPSDTQKKFIFQVELHGMEAIQTFIDNPYAKTINGIINPTYTPPTTTSQPPRIRTTRASGGYVQKGGWAIVGDAPGGKTTPFTETIHALPGGGVQVFNQSQKSIPAMAGGGTLMPEYDGFDYDRLARLIKDAVLLVAR